MTPSRSRFDIEAARSVLLIAVTLALLGAVACGGGGPATMSFTLDLSPTFCSQAEFVRAFVVDEERSCLLGGPTEVAEGNQISFDNLAIQSGTRVLIRLIALRRVSSSTERCYCASEHRITAADGLQQTLQLRPLTSTALCQPPRERECTN